MKHFCNKNEKQPSPPTMAAADRSSISTTTTTNKKEEGEGGSHAERSRCCFEEWMQLQREDLSHLLDSLHAHNDEELTKKLIRNCIAHFEGYVSSRSRLAEEDASSFYAPTWCTSLENSLLWIAGCRPSNFIRLVYALSGCATDANLRDWLEGLRHNYNSNNVGIGELSPSQMTRVNGLHMRTIKAEEKLTSEMASSQEDLADQPIAGMIAKEMEGVGVGVGEPNEEVEMALKVHEKVMGGILEKADALRLKTLKEIVLEILKPVQALQFLIAGKKLHFSLHEWGRRIDEKQGRTRSYY